MNSAQTNYATVDALTSTAKDRYRRQRAPDYAEEQLSFQFFLNDCVPPREFNSGKKARASAPINIKSAMRSNNQDKQRKQHQG